MDASLTQGVLHVCKALCLLGRYNLHGYGEKANARESGCDCVLEPRKDENGTCNRQASYVTKIEKKQETSEFSAVMTTYLRPWSSNDRRSHDLPAFRSFRPVTSVRSHPQLRLRLHLSSLYGDPRRVLCMLRSMRAAKTHLWNSARVCPRRDKCHANSDRILRHLVKYPA